MTIQRAQEISESPTMVHVTYNGDSVYIQHIDTNKETARIYPLSDPRKEQDVPVSDLMESDKSMVRE
ncbi:H-type small acid-soluble spore protein [Sporolactobacillus shoreae]|uniref:H-type small acid-soluble spore protein n=1 Tax=Sporolactobacillus shoreae TaxID=1465501 RepID=A0A4Z0GLB2_9BACL|nr:H-type small acid-soluble spore protein [Sporolactobacillus shoreae]TGA97773.1 H-type small acid-soluble spore protein [Sporolactobacillus shoreae]